MDFIRACMADKSRCIRLLGRFIIPQKQIRLPVHLPPETSPHAKYVAHKGIQNISYTNHWAEWERYKKIGSRRKTDRRGRGVMSECKEGAHMHTEARTHASAPAYTNLHCNKVILWPAQVNKVQERECGRSRRKWLSICWLIISRRRRDMRGEEDRSTHTEKEEQNDGKSQEDGV